MPPGRPVHLIPLDAGAADRRRARIDRRRGLQPISATATGRAGSARSSPSINASRPHRRRPAHDPRGAAALPAHPVLSRRRARVANPAVADEQIVAPIVVTGPARSGTTILFELLALDAGLRSPIATDVMHPACPRRSTPATRRAMTESEQELWADVQPEFAAIHELRADLPVECITIAAPSFAGSHWSMVLDDPGAWAPDPVYGLRVPQGRAAVGPARQAGEAVAAQDPGVHLHARRPAEGLPRRVDRLHSPRPGADDAVDGQHDGDGALAAHRQRRRRRCSRSSSNLIFSAGLNTIAERHHDGTLPEAHGSCPLHRPDGGPGRRDRRGVRRDRPGLHRRRIVRRSSATWRTSRAGKHGRHDYTAEEWGFDADALREDGTATYLSTFGIAQRELSASTGTTSAVDRLDRTLGEQEAPEHQPERPPFGRQPVRRRRGRDARSRPSTRRHRRPWPARG